MNTYKKYCPDVFLAKCQDKKEKGETIEVTTKRGKKNLCIVQNLIFEKEGFFYYSIIRADGINGQQRAKNKIAQRTKWAESAKNKSNDAFLASQKDSEFLSLGEPVKIGHHSERRHRKIIEQANTNMRKSIDFDEKAKNHLRKGQHYEKLATKIDLSMPESIGFFKNELSKAIKHHEGLKNGSIKREHYYSLTYANKKVKDLKKKYAIAQKLWG